MLFIGLTLVGCARPTGKGLADDDPSFKIPAIKQAAATHDTRAIPELIRSLDDDDPAVRFYAIQALKRLTGQTFDYRFYEEASQRRASIDRWEEWLEHHHRP